MLGIATGPMYWGVHVMRDAERRDPSEPTVRRYARGKARIHAHLRAGVGQRSTGEERRRRLIRGES